MIDRFPTIRPSGSVALASKRYGPAKFPSMVERPPSRRFSTGTTDIASCFGIVACGVEGAAACHRQLECLDEQFSLKFFCESCARIDYHLSSYRIPGVIFKFLHARGDCRQFLRGNAREFPCDLWRVDLEKGEAHLLARAGKHLSWMERSGTLL